MRAHSSFAYAVLRSWDLSLPLRRLLVRRVAVACHCGSSTGGGPSTMIFACGQLCCSIAIISRTFSTYIAIGTCVGSPSATASLLPTARVTATTSAQLSGARISGRSARSRLELYPLYPRLITSAVVRQA